jgi:site-specific DNA-adenine methylase
MNFTQAPLPFQGQKRNFVNTFKSEIEKLPDDTIFIDLFGGSGLLSRAAKDAKPKSRVIYNDFDDFRLRLQNVDKTNQLLDDLRPICAHLPKEKIMPKDEKEQIIKVVEMHVKNGFSDFITLSSSLLFSMNYALSLDELKRATLYNNIKQKNYFKAKEYLNGLEIRKSDYRELFDEFKDNPKAFFICDPPYLSTDAKCYETYWKLRDYLAVLNCLRAQKFAFFTSEKSTLIELLKWLEENTTFENPLKNARKVEVKTSMTAKATYLDIMFLKAALSGDDSIRVVLQGR